MENPLRVSNKLGACNTCRGEAASKALHEELGQTLAELTPLVNMAFFSLAGASLILVGCPAHTLRTLSPAPWAR